MFKHLFLFCFFSATAWAVDSRWTVSSQSIETNYYSLYQGETLNISVLLQSYSQRISTNGTAAFLYRTNSATGWWALPASVRDGRVTATFAPTNDVGASRYFWFIRFDDGAVNYRINGVINMLPSPGFVPNELPRPTYTIDFAQISYTNAPWATVLYVNAAQSNTLTSAEQMIMAAHSNALAAAYAEGWLSYTNSTLYSAILASNIAAAVAHSGTQYVNTVVSSLKFDRLAAGGNPFYTAALSADDGRVDVYRHVITSVPGDPPASSTQIVHVARLATTNDIPTFLAAYVTTNQLSSAVSPSTISDLIRDIGFVGSDDYGITWDDGDLKLYRTAASHTDDSVASWSDVTTSAATTLQASIDYTHQYVLDTFNDADLATLTAVGIEIGFHSTNATAHADIRASITNIPAQVRIPIINAFSTNLNSILYLSGSNGALHVQEVIP